MLGKTEGLADLGDKRRKTGAINYTAANYISKFLCCLSYLLKVILPCTILSFFGICVI